MVSFVLMVLDPPPHAHLEDVVRGVPNLRTRVVLGVAIALTLHSLVLVVAVARAVCGRLASASNPRYSSLPSVEEMRGLDGVGAGAGASRAALPPNAAIGAAMDPLYSDDLAQVGLLSFFLCVRLFCLFFSPHNGEVGRWWEAGHFTSSVHLDGGTLAM